jgi:hypothetical protein
MTMVFAGGAGARRRSGDREKPGAGRLRNASCPPPCGRHPAAAVLAILPNERRPRSLHPCSIDLRVAHEPVIPRHDARCQKGSHASPRFFPVSRGDKEKSRARPLNVRELSSRVSPVKGTPERPALGFSWSPPGRDRQGGYLFFFFFFCAATSGALAGSAAPSCSSGGVSGGITVKYTGGYLKLIGHIRTGCGLKSPAAHCRPSGCPARMHAPRPQRYVSDTGRRRQSNES